VRKATFTKRILVFQVSGFAVTLALLWANEFGDLPHRLLGAPATPLNWRESVLESVVVLVVAAGTIWWTARALAAIHILGGNFPYCICCGKVHVDGEWTPRGRYIARHKDTLLSDGLCPECKGDLMAEEASGVNGGSSGDATEQRNNEATTRNASW
jgi:hypothetical protein